MRRSFRLAHRRKLLRTIPVFELLHLENARQGFVEPADFESLVRQLPVDLEDFARFAYLTGWRRGEISSLAWSEVDLDAQTIRLRQEYSKNGRPRLIPVEGRLAVLLKRRWDRRGVRKPDGTVALCKWVFHRAGRRVQDFRKRWRRACATAGLPGLIFHDLRRSAVRNMIRAGVAEKVAMEISGHKTRAIFDRYHIVNEDDLRSALRSTQDFVASQPRRRKMPGDGK